MRIGLFGGTFNPPHIGHFAVARTALKMLQLDAIWWLVTPKNPLKRQTETGDFTLRIRQCRQMAQNPAFVISDLEKIMNTQETLTTVKKIRKYYQKTDFVWIAGFDNALIFHKWTYWRCLIKEIPFCFIARPPAVSLIKKAPIRLQKSVSHRVLNEPERVDLNKRKIFYIYRTQMHAISSTDIRKNRELDFN